MEIGATAFLGEPQPAVPAAPPDRAHLRRRDTAQQERADLAVLRKQPVGLAQARRRADLRGLLAAARREQRELALALQVDELAVEFAGDGHHLVQPAQRLGWQVSAVSGLGGRRPVRGDQLNRLQLDGSMPSQTSVPERTLPYRLLGSLTADRAVRRLRCSARRRSEQNPWWGAVG